MKNIIFVFIILAFISKINFAQENDDLYNYDKTYI